MHPFSIDSPCTTVSLAVLYYPGDINDTAYCNPLIVVLAVLFRDGTSIEYSG